jgi:hypothetical protein
MLVLQSNENWERDLSHKQRSLDEQKKQGSGHVLGLFLPSFSVTETCVTLYPRYPKKR